MITVTNGKSNRNNGCDSYWLVVNTLIVVLVVNGSWLPSGNLT